MNLQIFIEVNGAMIRVGAITGDGCSDAVFQYDSGYLAAGKPISVSLPLQKAPFDPVRTGNFFEGLLPEGFTRRSVAEWMHGLSMPGIVC